MTERVIGQCGQADHRVVAGQLARLGVPDVERRPRADALWPGAEVTSLIKAGIEPVHLVPGTAQERDQNGSDVAAITRNENPHRQLPRLFADEIDAGGGATQPTTIRAAPT